MGFLESKNGPHFHVLEKLQQVIPYSLINVIQIDKFFVRNTDFSY